LVRDLPEPIQQAVREGRLSPHAAMRAVLPLARANTADALRLVQAVASSETPVTSRQWESLHTAYRRADSQGRERLVHHPLLYLQTTQEAARPDAPEPSVAALLAELRALAGRIRQIRRRLGELPAALPVGPAVRCVFSEAHADFQALTTAFTERVHARPGDPNRDLAPAP
jgi:hypothetical protein